MTGPREGSEPLRSLLRLNIRDERGHGRLDSALIERLLAGLRSADEALMVTLQSDTGVFCEGLDLSSLAEEEADPIVALERFVALLDAIDEAPRPVIALVDGSALGGGLALAAASDLVLASPRATFGLPEALFGLIPAMAFPSVARRVGHARARWLALSAVTLTAHEAWRLGLVDEVVDDLEAALARYARRFRRLDARAVAEVKALAATHARTPADDRERTAAGFHRLAASQETRQRIQRFLAGESPWPEGD